MAGNTSIFFTSAWIEPQISFSSAGMTMADVTGNYQFTGIQSVQRFVPPFTVQATVNGTVANGNPFEFYLIKENLSQHLSVAGNFNKCNTVYYGLWLSCNGPIIVGPDGRDQIGAGFEFLAPQAWREEQGYGDHQQVAAAQLSPLPDQVEPNPPQRVTTARRA